MCVVKSKNYLSMKETVQQFSVPELYMDYDQFILLDKSNNLKGLDQSL